jgi:hypothetical protein
VKEIRYTNVQLLHKFINERGMITGDSLYHFLPPSLLRSLLLSLSIMSFSFLLSCHLRPSLASTTLPCWFTGRGYNYNCKNHQHKLRTAIKQARFIGLLSFTDNFVAPGDFSVDNYDTITANESVTFGDTEEGRPKLQRAALQAVTLDHKIK